MSIYKVDDLTVNGFMEKLEKDVIMMGISVTSSECQLVEFLEEFLSRFRTLSQQCQLIFSVGLLVGILEGFFAFLPEVLKCSPSGKTHPNDLVDEIGRKLLR